MPEPGQAAPSAHLQDWLLSRAVDGDGAIVGSVQTDGRPRYTYPEIGGYYLSWLAWLVSLNRAPADAPQRGAAIARWLQHWQAGDQRTRPGQSATDDWRNRGLFAFDLAMLLRGLAAAKSQEIISAAVADHLAATLVAQLSRLLDNQGLLRPVLILRGSLPRRWSTDSGPYQAKVGAALLLAAAQFRLPSVMVMAANRLLQTAAASPGQLHSDSAHAAMYALEGLTIGIALGVLPVALAPAVATHLDDWRGSMATAISDHRAENLENRHDVLAQWLRLAKIHRPDDGLIGPAEAALHAAIAADGSLAFAAAPFDQGPCTWAALFADQALWPQPTSAEYLL